MVKAVEATKRIHPRSIATLGKATFYSEQDVWLFQGVLDTKICPVCQTAVDIGEFRGNHLRMDFPYHEIVDVDTIDANVHPHCRCTLVRKLD